jgi:hypothetical protein
MDCPFIGSTPLFAKHFSFFVREDLRHPLGGEILEIFKKEVSHKIPQASYC